MIDEKIELRLPDGTRLIAETQRDIDYPAININYIDAENNFDTVAFAEYNPEKPFGQKVCVGVYQNQDEDTKFYDTFCHCIRPTFSELEELYRKDPGAVYVYQIVDGYVELKDSSNNTVVYREFFYDNRTNHTGHEVKLSQYGQDETTNYSFECFDCNEVIYSVEKPTCKEIDSDEVEFEVRDITNDESYTNPRITYLDDVENECWELFKDYASYVGVEFGEGIDYSIAKELSEKFMAVVERVFGIPFPMSKEG